MFSFRREMSHSEQYSEREQANLEMVQESSLSGNQNAYFGRRTELWFLGCKPTVQRSKTVGCPMLQRTRAKVPPLEGIEDNNMARTATDLSENPGSADELVRDLEDSGYPVDGSREHFILQSDGLAAATNEVVAAPVQLDTGGAQGVRATPSDDEGTSDHHVPNQVNAANSRRAS